jgi:hypothetical protein
MRGSVLDRASRNQGGENVMGRPQPQGHRTAFAANRVPITPYPAGPLAAAGSQSVPMTLLELVEAANDVFDSEEEVVSHARHLLATGRVRLTGNFRGVPVATLLGSPA